MSLTIEPLYQSFSLGGLLTVTLAVALLMITPRGLRVGQRRWLRGLRAIAAVALALTMWRPALVQEDNRPASATLAIAIDTSRSMTLASGERQAEDTRWGQQRRAIERLAAGLAGLDEELQVEVLAYDARSRSLGTVTADRLPTWWGSLVGPEPDGDLTNLAAPLAAAINSAAARPLAGVVLLSDGNETINASDASPGQDASLGHSDSLANSLDPRRPARIIAAQGVPLWTVALGPAEGMVDSRDVAVRSLAETFRLYSGNESAVRFELALRAVAGVPIEVQLEWLDAVDSGASTGAIGRRKNESRIAATQVILASGNDETIAMSIPVVAPEPGQYQLRVRAATLEGELITQNNMQVAFVEVREGGGRVLLLEGAVRLETTDLRRALQQFPDLELTYRWIPRDTVKRWPIMLDEDFARHRYDIVVLGDLHNEAIGPAQLESLRRFVDDGHGLITLGGQDAYGPGGYATSPLAEVLPIRMNDRARRPPGVEPDASFGKGAAQRDEPTRLLIATPHPITTINLPGDGVESTWETIPPQLGANVWDGVKVAPGTQVLLDDPSDRPMMVVGQYGRGRVASLAFDSTWTWVRQGHEEFHRRFWRQLMLWLLSREETESRSLQIAMERRRISASRTATFTATYRPDGAQPVTGQVGLAAEVVRDDGSSQKIAGELGVSDGEGASEWTLAGTLPELPPGFHRLRVSAGGEAKESAEMVFQVIDDTRELASVVTDHGLLRQLSLLSAESGGRAWRPDQMDELIQEIRGRRLRAQRVVIEKSRLGDDPLSGWLVFLLFAIPLSTEWWLRRRWGVA